MYFFIARKKLNLNKHHSCLVTNFSLRLIFCRLDPHSIIPIKIDENN